MDSHHLQESQPTGREKILGNGGGPYTSDLREERADRDNLYDLSTIKGRITSL